MRLIACLLVGSTVACSTRDVPGAGVGDEGADRSLSHMAADAREVGNGEPPDFDARLPCATERVRWDFADQLSWTKPVGEFPELVTLDEVREKAESYAANDGFRGGVTLSFHPRHRTLRFEDGLYAAPGEDVEFAVGWFFPEGVEPRTRIQLSVLVNVQPAEGEYVRWLEPRGGAHERWMDTGVDFELDGVVELTDVRLPASQFEAGKAYELTLVMMSHGETQTATKSVRRVQLYYGGYEWPESPCVAEISMPYTVDEESYLRHEASGSSLGAVLLPSYEASNPFGANEFHSIAAGEEVKVRVSAKNYASDDLPRQVSATAFLDGRPIGGPWWFRQSPGGDAIAWRDEFSFSAPQTPGRHDFFVLYTTDALIPSSEPPDGRLHYHNGSRRSIREGRTNVLKLQVK